MARHSTFAKRIESSTEDARRKYDEAIGKVDDWEDEPTIPNAPIVIPVTNSRGVKDMILMAVPERYRALVAVVIIAATAAIGTQYPEFIRALVNAASAVAGVD